MTPNPSASPPTRRFDPALLETAKRRAHQLRQQAIADAWQAAFDRWAALLSALRPSKTAPAGRRGLTGPAAGSCRP